MSRKTHPGLSQLFRENPLLGLFHLSLPPLWVQAEQDSQTRAGVLLQDAAARSIIVPAVLGSYLSRDNLSWPTAPTAH